jgi:hypothetical protein
VKLKFCGSAASFLHAEFVEVRLVRQTKSIRKTNSISSFFVKILYNILLEVLVFSS